MSEKQNAKEVLVHFLNILILVALQMPEGLLMFACTIADILEQ